MTLVAGLLRFVFFVVAAVLSLSAISAAFGFAVPLFDAFNHLQPLWFAGTLVGLLTTGLFFRRERSRALMIALSATGFLTSGIIVVPEFLSSFLARPEAPAGVPTYRLMTYNLFGLNYDMTAVAAMIARENPDIVALEEYFPEQREPLHPLLVASYPHYALCLGGKRANVAIYAKLPFASRGGDPCDWDPDRRTGFLSAAFAPENGAAFTVVVTQLDWPLQVSPLFEPGDLWGRIAAVTERQRAEFSHLSNGLSGILGPLVLVGDLNATPWSYELRRFALENGLARDTRDLPTFPKLWFFDTWREVPAFLPLDHVMSRGGFLVTDVRTGMATGSDHLPVIASFAIAPSSGGV